MKIASLLSAALLASLTVACSSPESPTSETANASPGDIAQPTAVTANPLHEIPTGNGDTSPLGIDAAHTVLGELASPADGSIAAFQVQIANYGNTSDGNLSVKLCQAQVCAEGSAALTASKDNEYLNFALAQPLVVGAGQPLTYTLTRIDGGRPLSVWTYPAATGSSGITLPDGSSSTRNLRIALLYSGN